MSLADADNLAAALAELAASATGHDNDLIVPPGERLCPICSELMNTLDEYGIAIDVCPQHGVWLDQGEFARILERAYWHRRELERHPRPDSTQALDQTRSQFIASLNRIASMIG